MEWVRKPHQSYLENKRFLVQQRSKQQNQQQPDCQGIWLSPVGQVLRPAPVKNP